MSQEKRLKRIDREKLPLFYRAILKLPFPTISSRINIPSGIFWAMFFPIFITLEIFLNMYLIIAFSFPINILLVCVFPVASLVIFIRATMNRFIDWWNSAVIGGYVQRDIKRVMEEYIALRKAKSTENMETEKEGTD